MGSEALIKQLKAEGALDYLLTSLSAKGLELHYDGKTLALDRLSIHSAAFAHEFGGRAKIGRVGGDKKEKPKTEPNPNGSTTNGKAVCSEPCCMQEIFCKGMCKTHYYKKRAESKKA